MSKKETTKVQLHPRNKHRFRYDFKQLCTACPELSPFVHINQYQNESIDFADPEAVKMLNKALLKQYYKIDYWDIPSGYLCPPIPGRADYIHHIADVLGAIFEGGIPRGKGVRCLDIGVGANCVYPIIGCMEYGWRFVGTDIDDKAVKVAKGIVSLNKLIKGKVEIRKQPNPNDIFRGVIEAGEHFHLSICNPPFHASAKAAETASMQKNAKLKGKKASNAPLNFGGNSKELWCEGGEKRFISNMILQSKEYADSCEVFSTLVSKQEHLKGIYDILEKVGASAVKTVQMEQGSKISRIVAWTF